ncbi:MAG: GNAT family N-acetyltransferase [Phycisphaerales bacterium]
MTEHTTIPVRVTSADLDDPAQCAAIVDILDSYATDPIGGATPLSREVRECLVPALRRHPTTRVLIAFAGERAVGIAICFVGFSTFAARPLINIHDLAVLPEWRGRGVGRALLAGVEALAAREGCCKLTLEVLNVNRRALGLYRSAGFSDYEADPDGATWFLTKPLAAPPRA